MKCKALSSPFALFLIAALAVSASAQHLQSYSFYGQNGSSPSGGLVVDSSGSFYGTTRMGGAANAGLVYKVNPTSETTLYTFQGNANGNTDGLWPVGNLVFDGAGNLYGVTSGGGTGTCPVGCGTVFELSPPSSQGGSWTETILYNFQNSSTDGGTPLAGLIFDNAGNLYGTTEDGGDVGAGTVFELSPPSQPGGAWIETVLHSFQGYPTDGDAPSSPLILDQSGNLYGTTNAGSSRFMGCVFELSPASQPGGTWTETLLHSFYRADGTGPIAGLTWGPGGALFGTTTYDGPNGSGTVFRMSSTAQGAWDYYVVYGFQSGFSGASPVVFGSPTTLYGATINGHGVYEISYSGGNAAFTILATPGSSSADLLLYQGAIYGTTSDGGAHGRGSAYRLSP